MSFLLSPLGAILGPLIVVAFYVVPLGLIVWTIVTLSRLKSGQADIQARLAAIERRLREKS